MDIDQIQAERQARKDALAEQKKQQQALDYGALNNIEIERGDENVAVVDVGRYSPGLSTIAVVRPLSKAELKRFRDRTRPKNADAAVAAEEAANSCLLYPSAEEWPALCEAVPGLAVRVGVAAVQLAAGLETEEGK